MDSDKAEVGVCIIGLPGENCGARREGKQSGTNIEDLHNGGIVNQQPLWRYGCWMLEIGGVCDLDCENFDD